MTRRTKRFHALVQDGHKGCAVEVPFDPRATWGVEPSVVAYGRVRGIPVRGSAGGASFESCIIRRWGKYFLLLSAEVVENAGLTPGEDVEIAVSPAISAPSE